MLFSGAQCHTHSRNVALRRSCAEVHTFLARSRAASGGSNPTLSYQFADVVDGRVVDPWVAKVAETARWDSFLFQLHAGV